MDIYRVDGMQSFARSLSISFIGNCKKLHSVDALFHRKAEHPLYFSKFNLFEANASLQLEYQYHAYKHPIMIF